MSGKHIDVKKQDILSKIIGYILIAFFLCIVVSKLAYVFTLVPWYIAICGIAVVLVVSTFVFLKYKIICEKLSSIFKFVDKLSYLKMIIFIALLSLITKLVAVFVLKIDLSINPDCKVYIETAYELANYGRAITNAGYCYAFSHMYWFAMFLVPVTKLFGMAVLPISVYLSITATISSVLLFDVIAKKFSKNRAFIIMVIINLLPSNILLPQYITHENGMLFFLSVAIWLYFGLLPILSKMYLKILVYSLFTINLFFANAVNSSGIVLFIAFPILFIIDFINTKGIKAFEFMVAKVISLILVLVIGTATFNAIQVATSEIPENYKPENKFMWTLYVGSTMLDFYDAGEVWNNTEMSDEELDSLHKELLTNNYKHFLEKPTDLFSLLGKKFASVWQDFDYPVSYSNETISNDSVKSIYNRFLFKPLTLLNYITLLIIAEFGLCSLIRKRKAVKNDFYLLLELYLLGGTALLMLTECKNKYSIAMQPIFIIVALVFVSVYFCRKDNSKIENEND